MKVVTLLRKPLESEQQPDEQVPVWSCVKGCAVADLNQQSGYLKTGKGMRGSGADIDYADQEAGASRFFKQVKP